MYQISNFTENDDVNVLVEFGAFKVIEWKRDLSVTESSAITAYFASEMNVRRRQVICDLSQAPITVQAGAMQWSVGNVNTNTGVKGAGDFFGKALRGSVTGESAIKPEYEGTGLLVLEPTYRYIIVLDVADWGNSIVLDDGLFLACYSSLQHKAVMRSNISSAVAGNEGLFNLGIQGYGALVPGIALPERRAHRSHARQRRAQGGRKYGAGLERIAQLHRGAIGQVAHRVGRFGRRSGERLPRHGQGPARSHDVLESSAPADFPETAWSKRESSTRALTQFGALC